MHNKEQAERQIAAHELAAKRNPRKHKDHTLAARLLRQAHRIAEPEPIVNPTTSRNAEAHRAEAERIRKYKEMK